MRRVWRLLRGALALVMIGATLSACGSSSASSSVSLGHGVTVVVPAGANFTPRETLAPQSASSLLAQVKLPHSKTGPSPFTALITPVHLRWSGAFPTQGVELHFHVKASSVSAGTTPFVATYDPTTKIWHPVASTYDAKSGVVSAHAAHFSIWGVFDFAKSALTALVKDIASSLFGSIKVSVPAPSCSDSTGLTAVAAPTNGILDVCAQNDGTTSVTLKVRSHLAFPVDVIPPLGTTISVTPSGGIFEQIGGYLNKVGTGQSTRTLVATGSEADLTFPLSANHSVVVRSDLDTEAYLASIIDSAVSLLTVMSSRLGGNPKAVLDSIAKGACAAQVVQAVDASSTVSLSTIAALTRVAVACASSVVDLGVSGVIQGIVATASGLFENVLQTGFLGAMIIVGGLSGTASTITVSRAAASAAACTTTAIMAPVAAYSAVTYGYVGFYKPEGQPTCHGGWATLQTEEVTSTGQFLGPDQEYAQLQHGAWKVIALVDGGGDLCQSVPAAGVAALGITDSGCPDSNSGSPATTTTIKSGPSELPVLHVVGADGSTVFNGRRPRWIHYSADETDVVQDITWSSWTATSATGSGTWNYDSCSPNCYSAPRVPYPATITLTDPQGGMFTTMTETTSGPHGSTTVFKYPRFWAMSACLSGPC